MNKTKTSLRYTKETENKNRVRMILAEQLKLTRVERELEDLLRTVNEQINTLEIEELQLKAHFVCEEQKHNPDKKQIPENKINSILKNNPDIPEEINKQFLDLDTFVEGFEEEIDSD